MSARLLAAALTIALGLAPAAARAEEPWQTDPESVAKELFFRGVKLLEAGETERALDAFLRSRATIARRGNTLNAALCLEKLGRHDEALELYEDIVARFAGDLPESERAALKRTMAELRARVGSLSVSTNVLGASLQVDGRARGTLPLSAPLRLTAGSHVVRVVKNGYETATLKIDVRAQEARALDVELTPLKDAGELRIEAEDGQPAEVFVDGAMVGQSPWEGRLSAGKHAIWLQRGDLGSAPTALVIVGGQVSLSRLGLTPLGAEATVAVEPRTAEISVDGVVVGVGTFSARLPKGTHKLRASEPGYITRTAQLDVSDPAVPQRLDWELAVDAAHPRWPRPPSGRFWVGAQLAYAGSGSLGSGAEAACAASCVYELPASGALIGGRLGYRFPVGVSLELGGGWVGLTKSLYRVERDSFVAAGARHAVRYDLEEQVSLSGPMISTGVSYAAPVGWRLSLVSRLSAAVFFAGASDLVERAVARTTGAAVPAYLYGPRSEVSSIVPAIVPELGLELPLGDARLGLSLAAMFLPLAGPDYQGRRLGVEPAPDPTDPSAIGNAPQSDVIDDERSFGLTAVFLPGLTFRYEL